MKRWLVTGGCGFIGSHLVDALLARGDTVRILDDLSTGKRHDVLAGAELRVGDVADRDEVARALTGVDGCFHLAAVASVERCTQDWLGSHRTNLTGTVTVFDAARSAGPSPLPVVYASSAAVYGDNPHVPLSETATTRPLSAYGADKLACEFHAQVAWGVHRVPNLGLRFFNVYGPRQDPSSPYSGVISIFSDRLAAGQPIDILGDGEQTRDFVYVSDVVSHLVAGMAVLREGAGLFNVCTGRAASILALARIMGEAIGRKPDIRHGPSRVGDIRSSIGDPSAAAAAFGFTAGVSLGEGIRRTLDYFRKSGTRPHAC